MKPFYKKLCLWCVATLCAVVFALSSAFAFGPQSSTCSADLGVLFCEPFDGLADWDATPCLASENKACGNEMANYPSEYARMPRLADGSESAWTYFSVWNLQAAPAPFIGSETASGRQVWRGTKSATIDIGETNYGPSRLGLYFGDWRNVQATDGLKRANVFYMTYIPRNSFPTHCQLDGGPVTTDCITGVPTGIYQDGSPYTYYPSWKFNTFNIECNGAQCPNSNTYGLHTIVPQIKQYNYTPKGLLLMHYDGINGVNEYAKSMDGGIPFDSLLGDWFGVEFGLKISDDGLSYSVSMWVYDKAGNVVQTLSEMTYQLAAEAQNGYWDSFFFGGNNANSWIYGPTMQSHYYVDDLIIDDGNNGRIGPRYFAAIAAPDPEPTPDPEPVPDPEPTPDPVPDPAPKPCAIFKSGDDLVIRCE